MSGESVSKIEFEDWIAPEDIKTEEPEDSPKVNTQEFSYTLNVSFNKSIDPNNLCQKNAVAKNLESKLEYIKVGSDNSIETNSENPWDLTRTILPSSLKRFLSGKGLEVYDKTPDSFCKNKEDPSSSSGQVCDDTTLANLSYNTFQKPLKELSPKTALPNISDCSKILPNSQITNISETNNLNNVTDINLNKEIRENNQPCINPKQEQSEIIPENSIEIENQDNTFHTYDCGYSTQIINSVKGKEKPNSENKMVDNVLKDAKISDYLDQLMNNVDLGMSYDNNQEFVHPNISKGKGSKDRKKKVDSECSFTDDNGSCIQEMGKKKKKKRKRLENPEGISENNDIPITVLANESISIKDEFFANDCEFDVHSQQEESSPKQKKRKKHKSNADEELQSTDYNFLKHKNKDNTNFSDDHHTNQNHEENQPIILGNSSDDFIMSDNYKKKKKKEESKYIDSIEIENENMINDDDVSKSKKEKKRHKNKLADNFEDNSNLQKTVEETIHPVCGTTGIDEECKPKLKKRKKDRSVEELEIIDLNAIPDHDPKIKKLKKKKKHTVEDDENFTHKLNSMESEIEKDIDSDKQKKKKKKKSSKNSTEVIGNSEQNHIMHDENITTINLSNISVQKNQEKSNLLENRENISDSLAATVKKKTKNSKRPEKDDKANQSLTENNELSDDLISTDCTKKKKRDIVLSLSLIEGDSEPQVFNDEDQSEVFLHTKSKNNGEKTSPGKALGTSNEMTNISIDVPTKNSLQSKKKQERKLEKKSKQLNESEPKNKAPITPKYILEDSSESDVSAQISCEAIPKQKKQPQEFKAIENRGDNSDEFETEMEKSLETLFKEKNFETSSKKKKESKLGKKEKSNKLLQSKKKAEKLEMNSKKINRTDSIIKKPITPEYIEDDSSESDVSTQISCEAIPKKKKQPSASDNLAQSIEIDKNFETPSKKKSFETSPKKKKSQVSEIDGENKEKGDHLIPSDKGNVEILEIKTLGINYQASPKKRKPEVSESIVEDKRKHDNSKQIQSQEISEASPSKTKAEGIQLIETLVEEKSDDSKQSKKAKRKQHYSDSKEISFDASTKKKKSDNSKQSKKDKDKKPETESLEMSLEDSPTKRKIDTTKSKMDKNGSPRKHLKKIKSPNRESDTDNNPSMCESEDIFSGIFVKREKSSSSNSSTDYKSMNKSFETQESESINNISNKSGTRIEQPDMNVSFSYSDILSQTHTDRLLKKYNEIVSNSASKPSEESVDKRENISRNLKSTKTKVKKRTNKDHQTTLDSFIIKPDELDKIMQREKTIELLQQDKSIEEIEEELNISHYPEQEMKIKDLEIQLLHMPLVHKIAHSLGHNPTPEQRQQLAEAGIKLRVGKFTKEEDEKIRKRWNRFCEEYDWDKNHYHIFLSGCTMSKKGKLSSSQFRRFVYYISYEFDDRIMINIYKRFVRLFSNIEKQYYSEQDDAIIQEYVNSGKSSTPFADLAALLYKERNSIMKRYALCKSNQKNHNAKITWNKELTEELLANLIEVTRSIKLSELKNRNITGNEWTKISNKMNLPAEKLRRAWKFNFYPRFFSPNFVKEFGKVKMDLIDLLDERYNDFKEIDWHEVAKEFSDGFTASRLVKLFHDNLHKKVPLSKRHDFRKAIRILRKSIDPLEFKDRFSFVKEILKETENGTIIPRSTRNEESRSQTEENHDDPDVELEDSSDNCT